MGFVSLIFVLGVFLPIVVAANFTTYWNVFPHHCKNRLQPILDEYGIQTNANYKFEGEKIVIFYETKFGRYPYYNKSMRTLPVNGGTPQNLSKEQIEFHLNISEYNITTVLPVVNSSGLAIIDFEEWRPLFRYNNNNKTVYRDAAFEIVRSNHTTNLTGEQLNKTAKKEFNKAAKDFILKTIERAKQLRPNASWGLYGFPYCNYNAGKKGEYNCSKEFQQFNDDMMYIFNASTALFPSIYYSDDNDTSEQRFNYVQAILREANRISQKYDPPLPIFPYTKFEYDPVKKNCSFYNDQDLCSTIKQPALMGVNGLVFWSSSTNMQTRCNATMDFVKLKLGPIVQNVTQYYTPGPFNTSTILKFNETCASFKVPVNDSTIYGGLCNLENIMTA